MEKINNGYKLVFIDIDGTMLTSKKEVSEKTLFCFNKLKELGIEVVLTSGRQRSNVLKICESVNSGRFLISANGSDIYDRKLNREIYSKNISKESLEKIYSIVKKYSLRIRMITGNTSYVNHTIKNPLDENLLEINEKEFFENFSVCQCVIYIDSEQKRKLVKQEIENIKDVEILLESVKKSKDRNDYFMDICEKGVSKGKAINILCKHNKISPLETIAIGDGENDISMFKVVGVSISMGNSTEKVKIQSMLTTTSNDEDGVYNALKNLFDI